MVTKNTKASNADDIAFLKARLAELENKNSQDDDEDKPNTDEYISVMSLLPYKLNLSTKEGGQGMTKKFTRFGEIKKILYKDLIDILDVHSNFVEYGYFYILNPSFIRRHGLDEVYSKILTKEKIEEILSTSTEECVALYNSSNPKQQDIIVQLLIEKVKQDINSVDLNIIDKISRISKTEILKIAEESKILQEEKKAE